MRPKRIIAAGGKLTICDDAHRTEQIGLNFRPTREYLQSLGVGSLYYLSHDQDTGAVRAAEAKDWASHPIFDKCPVSV
jgi:hypothetical protein